MKKLLASYGADIAGFAGIGLLVAAAWGFGGWRWAAIVAGAPVAAFYLYGEFLQLRS